MKISIISLLIMINSFVSFSQSKDTLQLKSNPVVFGEFYVGYISGMIGYETTGAGLKYQRKKDLFAFRYGNHQRYLFDGFFLFVPILYEHKYIHEYALMYGRRKYDDNQSLSFSLGVSYNIHGENIGGKLKSKAIWKNDNTIGISFECNVKWFKREKKPFRIFYGLFPVGEKTALGRSFGLKFQGNITKKPYFGMALVYGLGWHKAY